MDISGSLPAVLIEMLLDSAPGEVKLLPALPKAWPTGTLEGAILKRRFRNDDLRMSPERGCGQGPRQSKMTGLVSCSKEAFTRLTGRRNVRPVLGSGFPAATRRGGSHWRLRGQ
jgi:hypothetical protein